MSANENATNPPTGRTEHELPLGSCIPCKLVGEDMGNDTITLQLPPGLRPTGMVVGETVLIQRGGATSRLWEAMRERVEMAEQVSGELCEKCGWAMRFADEPCRCELELENKQLHRQVRTLEMALNNSPLPPSQGTRQFSLQTVVRLPSSDVSDKEINMAIAKYLGLAHIPDYCRDLNLMHDVEKSLSEDETAIYLDKLEAECGVDAVWTERYQAHLATAKQRARALLATIVYRKRTPRPSPSPSVDGSRESAGDGE